MPDELKAFVNLENGRTAEQIKLMQRIKEDGVCPFCIEHLRKYHPKPILRETDWWVVTENMSPYEGARVHYIFVYKPGHITLPSELSSEALIDLFTLFNWATETNRVIGGAFLMRFGDTAYNGASVDHLHAHLVATEKSGPDMEGLRMKIGFKKKSGV
ncbi:MAG: hypothetical protein WAT81_03950 [Candidatus Moraniibacteriota bacterium]